MSAQRPQRRPTGPSAPRAVPAPSPHPAPSPRPAPFPRRPRTWTARRTAPHSAGSRLRCWDSPHGRRQRQSFPPLSGAREDEREVCAAPLLPPAAAALGDGPELLAEGAAPSLRPAQGPVLELQLHICSRSLTSLPPAQPVRAAPPVSPQHRVLAGSLSLGVWGGPASSPSSAPAPPPLSPGHLPACTGCSHRPPPHTSGRTCHPQHHCHVGAGTSLPRQRSCV